MPGASALAAMAAQRAGAGYVKLLAEGCESPDPGLVCEGGPLQEAMSDERIDAVLVGPGLGRDDTARQRLAVALKTRKRTVLDADALVLLEPGMIEPGGKYLATPHDGELETLCRSFAVIADGRRARASALAKASGMVICAKGPDTIVASPDGRIAVAPPAPSWLSVAGTGDVLAGIAVSRMATGRPAFEAAKEAVYLHGQAARLCGPVLTPSGLACSVSDALAGCL